MQPADQTSHLKLYASLCSNSGEAKQGVPLSRDMQISLEISSDLRLRAQPKSAIFMVLLPATRMFYGLRSRWMTPLLFMNWKASTSCRNMLMIY